MDVGRRNWAHCTASGKTFLASLRPAERRAFVSAIKLERHTPNTHLDPESLLEDLGSVAKLGYALDREEFVEGMVAIAVPVKDRSGRYLASIAFHAPVQRVSVEGAIAQKDVLQEAANALADVLIQ